MNPNRPNIFVTFCINVCNSDFLFWLNRYAILGATVEFVTCKKKLVNNARLLATENRPTSFAVSKYPNKTIPAEDDMITENSTIIIGLDVIISFRNIYLIFWLDLYLNILFQ